MNQSNGKSMLCCTLTGIDDCTDMQAIWELGREFPFVEFGVLYSESQAGTGRYPSKEFLNELVARLQETRRPRFALHVCGRAVSALLDTFSVRGDVGYLKQLASHFPRIQLNLRANESTGHQLKMALKVIPRQILITQHNRGNAPLTVELADEPRHAALFDESGGRGLSPENWPRPLPGKIFGYAGGLGPDNLQRELPRIAVAAGGQPFWIDMEGKLRNQQDRFDIPSAEACLVAVQRYLNAPTVQRSLNIGLRE